MGHYNDEYSHYTLVQTHRMDNGKRELNGNHGLWAAVTCAWSFISCKDALLGGDIHGGRGRITVWYVRNHLPSSQCSVNQKLL